MTNALRRRQAVRGHWVFPNSSSAFMLAIGVHNQRWSPRLPWHLILVITRASWVRQSGEKTKTEHFRMKVNIVSDPAKVPPWKWKAVIFFWTHPPFPKSVLSWGEEVCSTGEKFQRKQNVPGTETLVGGGERGGTVSPMDSGWAGSLGTPGCCGKAMLGHSAIPSTQDLFT